jgi:hypothetical protein
MPTSAPRTPRVGRRPAAADPVAAILRLGARHPDVAIRRWAAALLARGESGGSDTGRTPAVK